MKRRRTAPRAAGRAATRASLRLVRDEGSPVDAPASRPVPVGRARCDSGDALSRYDEWPRPVCIVADGPYGLGKYPGEPKNPRSLGDWYAPHVAAWAAHASPSCTLWFWCSEIGWATVHPMLETHGFQYEECNVWDKGIAHVAGNCNSKTIRGMPVVTEVAVRYTRRNLLPTAAGESLSIKEWLRHEWGRSGLPLSQSNAACGVANAATRKYLTQCHLWYFPPADAVVRMARYCTRYGKRTDRPYFSLDGRTPIAEAEWNGLRAKWNHAHGVSNVWREPAVHGQERVRLAQGYLHANQKPLSLMRRQIAASTDPGDVVWEPFGGLCSASVAAIQLDRSAFAAEINPQYLETAVARLKHAAEERNRCRDAAA